MSILDRLNLLIRSNVNEGLGRHGQPSSRKLLSEVESSIRDARRQQVELRRGEKQLIDQIREARDRADQWEDRAMLALRKGDEDLAREALAVKNQAMNEARRLRDQLDDHRAYIKDLERALEALEMKLEGRRTRMSVSSSPRKGDASDWDRRLEARHRDRPRPTSPVDDEERADASFDTSRSFQEIDRMASKIDSMEAEIEAMRELGGDDARQSELESRFRSLENRTSRRESSFSDGPRSSEKTRPPMDDDLADLKKKFE